MNNAGRALLRGTLSLILAGSLVPSQSCVALAQELGEIQRQEATGASYVRAGNAAKVSFDENACQQVDGISYFSSSRVATVTVDDASMQSGEPDVVAEGGAVLSEWSQAEDGSWAKTVAFLDDGPCSLEVVRTTSEGARVQDHLERFVIDSRAPTVAVEQSKESSCYVRIFEACIADANLDPEHTEVFGVTLSELMQCSDGKGGIYENAADSPGKSIEWSFDQESGVYRFVVTLINVRYLGPFVKAADKAGNAVSTGQQEVVADSEAPQLVSASIDKGFVPTSRGNSAAAIDDGVLFFNNANGEAAVTVCVWDLTGISSVALEGSDQFALDEQRLSADGEDCSIIRLSPLTEQAALTKDAQLSMTDGSGNRRVWSLAELGEVFEAGAATGAPSKNEALAIKGAWSGHPRELIEDHTKPELALSGAPVQAYTQMTPTITLRVFEKNLAYLQRYDPSRVVMIISKRASQAGGPEVQRSYSVSDVFGKDALEVSLGEADGFGDGHYSVSAQLTDLAGNSSDVVRVGEFSIDSTAPRLSVSFDNDQPRGSLSGTAYYDVERTATIAVYEHNFDESLMKVDVTASGWMAAEPKVSAWTHEGDLHSCTVSFAEGGVYGLHVEGVDLAGNATCLDGAEGVSSYNSPSFVIDLTPPVITTTFAELEQEKTGAHDGVPYFSAPQSVTVSVADRNLDLSSSSITLDGVAVLPERWSSSAAEDGTVTYLFTASYGDGESATPAVEVMDLAAHEARLAPRAFVVDLEAPEVMGVTIGVAPASTGADEATGGDPILFFNQPATISFDVADRHRLGALELVDPKGCYVIRQDESGVAKGEVRGSVQIALEDGAAGLLADPEFGRDIYLKVSDVAGNFRIWTIDRTGKVKAQGAHDATNVSINGEGIYPWALIKDATPPLCALFGPDVGAYCRTPQSVHVTVDEHNFAYLQRFDPARAVVHVTRFSADAERRKESFEVSASAFRWDGSSWHYDVPCALDGHYVVEAGFADYANNVSNVAALGEFSVDMTPPAIAVSFDNDDVHNGSYYNAPRTATITVTEHNFDPSLISVQTTGRQSAWSSSGDVHSCTVFFDEGPSHGLSVSGADLAGNAAAPVTVDEFAVDLTAPTISFGGVAQRLGFTGEEDAYNDTLQPDGAYNGVVAPSITFGDAQSFDPGGTSFSLVGNKVGDVSSRYGSTSSVDARSRTVQFDDFGLGGAKASYDIGADDVYTMQAHVRDLAGNEAQATICFSVNRYGSNYVVTAEEGGRRLDLGAGGIVGAAPTIVVREINVSGAKSEASHRVLKEFANVTSELARNEEGEGGGYGLVAADRKDTEHGWAEYVYTIYSDNFGEGSPSDSGDGGQGTYRVNVVSDDAASNVNTTADFWESDALRTRASAKVGTAAFTLDEVGPVIDEVTLPAVLGPGAGHVATFYVSDAITEGNEVEVLVDGEPVAVRHGGEELAPGGRAGEGAFEFDIPARPFKVRSVSIRVTDYAGRVASRQRRGLYVSTLVPEGCALLGAAAALLGVFCRLRAKGSGREEGKRRG